MLLLSSVDYRTPRADSDDSSEKGLNLVDRLFIVGINKQHRYSLEHSDRRLDKTRAPTLC